MSAQGNSQIGAAEPIAAAEQIVKDSGASEAKSEAEPKAAEEAESKPDTETKPEADAKPEVEASAAVNPEADTKETTEPKKDETESMKDTTNGVKETVEKPDSTSTTKKPFARNNGKKRAYNPDANLSAKFEWPESSDPAEIRRQVEFYFSDNSLPMDKFLLEQTDLQRNKPMPLKTITNFKRMRRFQPYSAVVDALKESTTLDIAGDEGAETVVRKIPLSDKWTTDIKENIHRFDNESMPRTVYLKGFGAESPSTQYEIETFFAPYNPASVRLRRTHDLVFKGSVFILFNTEDEAKAFVEKMQDEKTAYNNTELDPICIKTEYIQQKIDENGGVDKRQQSSKRGGHGKDRGGRGRGGRGRGRGGSRGGRGGERGGKRERDDDGESAAKRVRTEE